MSIMNLKASAASDSSPMDYLCHRQDLFKLAAVRWYLIRIIIKEDPDSSLFNAN